MSAPFQSPLGTPSPRAEYPFPGHDWSSRSPRPSARRDSSASTTSLASIGGSLDIAATRRKNTVVESGQNAISSLLQPPILRTGLLPHTAIHSTSQKPPTSRDIPPVTLTNIPHVEPSAFKEYLSQVGGLFEAFHRAKLEAETGGAQLFRRDTNATKDEEVANLLDRGRRRDSTASVTNQLAVNTGVRTPLEGPSGRRRTSGSKRGQLAPTPLSTIPSIYFDQVFRLENPRTFDVVSEHSEVVKQPHSGSGDFGASNGSANGTAVPARKALATNAILQEKLSWYMDTVEIHLIVSISQASSSFFAALGSLRELQAEAADSVSKIQKLREDLARLDREMAIGGLEIIQKKRRRDNLQRLNDATEQLRCIIKGANHCEDLVDSGQLELALSRLPAVELLASGTFDLHGDAAWLLPNPRIRLSDLRRLRALDGLSKGINQLRLRIGKGYEARLLEVLLGDLRRHISSVPPKDTLARWSIASKRSRGQADVSTAPPAYMTTTEKLREELLPILQGLGHSNYLSVASTTFREAVIREMKTLIRRHLPSSTDDDNESVASVSTRASNRRPTQQEKSSILSRNLRALSSEDAEEFFVKVYCGIGEALRRLGIQVKVLLDVTSGMKKTSSDPTSLLRSPDRSDGSFIRSPSPHGGHNLQEELSQALDMSSLLGQAVDKAQSETTKILRVRNEQTIRLNMTDFLSYFTLNRLFANECEAVSGRSGAALKGVVNNQIHEFIPLLSEAEMQKLAQKMESDKWEPYDFSSDDSKVLAHVVQSMTTDPPAWLGYTEPSAAAIEANGNNNVSNGTAAEPSLMSKKDKTNPTLAVIEDEKFMLVESTAFALRGLEQYAILLASVPTMAIDISTVLLDYLKLFNSRTQQLILGAGATKTAGLSNINTKHLALASQALSFFIALIPYLREFVRRRPSITSANTSEYDRLKRLFQDHQSSIHDKLIDIMSARAATHINAMKKIKWDDESEIHRSVSPYMETLTKETLTLQRVLSKYLPALSVRMIVGPVFVSYREQWSKAFESATLKTEAGQARLLRDVALLDTKLGSIDGAGDIGPYLISIVKRKAVDSPPKTQTDTANTENTSKGPTITQPQEPAASAILTEESKDAG